MKKLADGNEWVWDSRWTHWWFKKIPGDSAAESEACMHPAYSGVIDYDELFRAAEKLKKHGINTVLTEGLRRLILFEQQGKTAAVNRGIAEAAKACHEAGIRVVHHITTVLAGHRLEEIPEFQRGWLNIDARTGEFAFLDCWGGWYLWCVNNPGFRQEYFRLCREAVRTTGVDGLMADEVYFRTGWHNCACECCREKYLQASGYHLPPGGEAAFWGNFGDPRFRAWIAFRTASVGDFYEDLRKEIEKEHPCPVLMGCKNHEPSPVCSRFFGENNEERMRGTNLLFIETGHDAFLYSWRRLSFEYMSYGGLSNYYGTPTVAIMYNLNPDEGFLGWALRSSHGIRVWATSRGGALAPGDQLLKSPEDMRLYGDLFSWEKKHENKLRGMIKPMAGIGVLLSAATRDMAWGAGAECPGDFYVKELIGWCQVLADEYFQYSILVQEQLNEDELDEYSLLILPNAVCLAPSAVEAVMNYLSRGGSLVFTGYTGACDETGAERGPEKSLSALLGSAAASSGDGAAPDFLEGYSGSGKWIYFSNLPGRDCYSGFNSAGDVRRRNDGEPETPAAVAGAQRSLMSGAVKKLMGPQPLLVSKAPPGLLIKAFRSYSGGKNAAVVHILNLRGESVEFGATIPDNYAVEYPEQEDEMVIEFNGVNINQARLISPDSDGERIMQVSGDGGSVSIPEGTIKRYGILCVE